MSADVAFCVSQDLEHGLRLELPLRKVKGKLYLTYLLTLNFLEVWGVLNLSMRGLEWIQSEFLNLLNNKNTDETSVVSKGPLPRSILDA